MSEPTAPTKRPTREEWVAIYLSLTEDQRQRLDRLVRCFTAKNEEAKS